MKCANIAKRRKSDRNQSATFSNEVPAGGGNLLVCGSDCKAPAELPVGGTTGLCHQSSEAISIAGHWYAENRGTCERPQIPALRRRFGLTTKEACQAIAFARQL